MFIPNSNDTTNVFDKHYALKCPHCGVQSNITAVSVPKYEYTIRFKPTRLGIVYRCDSCNAPIFLRFQVENYDVGHNMIYIADDFEEIERPLETFEFKYLPVPVADDFKEALTCYSNACFNAFAAMCRRCIQSVSTELGAPGKDRVHAQLKEIRDTAALDDETFAILEQVIISGHDGAHPHLPRLWPERAAVLLELMKDVLYQLFVRKAKIQESIELRKQAIAAEKPGAA